MRPLDISSWGTAKTQNTFDPKPKLKRQLPNTMTITFTNNSFLTGADKIDDATTTTTKSEENEKN